MSFDVTFFFPPAFLIFHLSMSCNLGGFEDILNSGGFDARQIGKCAVRKLSIRYQNASCNVFEMLSVERLDFSKEKLFINFRESLQKFDGKTKNLIDCKDDILFAWDDKHKKLLTQSLKILDKKSAVYQELFPTEPPIANIQFLRVNAAVSKAVLWGPKSASVIDIPKRWGLEGAFQGGKSTIFTRCKSIDDGYFEAHNIEIRQIRFHPGSVRDNHVLVLSSDNAFRLYLLPAEGTDAEQPEFLRSWSVGECPLNLSGRVPFLVSLGDTAVDFDFSIPVLDDKLPLDENDIRANSIMWPVIILRGNGDVCIMNTSLVNYSQPKIEGPLPIYPPADDNYGVDACSILVMPTLPNVVIIATSSGTVYHAVLLSTPKDENPSMSMASHGLYVLESVELELGLQLNDDASYTCPVILHKDPIFRWKYYCTHDSGIHAVLMSFVPEIEKFIDDTDSENFQFHGNPSTVEYLVCTRTHVTPASPVLGFTIIKSWNIILAVLSNGEVMNIPLKMADVFLNSESTSKEIPGDETPLKKLLKEPFEQHIKNLLKRTVNQPVLKLDKNCEMVPQDWLDLVTRTTTILREEYFMKMELVGDEIEQRASILTALKALQLKELQELEENMPQRKAAAERLARKYEEVKERHQSLVKRIEVVLIAVKKFERIETLAERRMKNELVNVEEKLESYEKLIKQLKDKLDYQKFKIEERKLDAKKVNLGENQIEMIKKNLIKFSGEIADLVSIVNTLKRQLNNALN